MGERNAARAEVGAILPGNDGRARKGGVSAELGGIRVGERMGPVVVWSSARVPAISLWNVLILFPLQFLWGFG